MCKFVVTFFTNVCIAIPSNTNRVENEDKYVYYVKSMTIKQVPEPGLLLLVLTGLVGVIAARRMRVQI
ncbi:hypothetical protein BMS3Bbin11_01261 [bacterium BMS3Bbin11]|nr:hypothetical protein BMS3Bbin11_01261 [bacterium BMS3Bbin11]HDH15987.1 PEP-CTERM sorting domain-containing protein [Gammaproteobacteria bacterium]HDZ79243.1 PEP-CTERM sorting domain-containing protein [Gammaproteobacteria bacterium]